MVVPQIAGQIPAGLEGSSVRIGAVAVDGEAVGKVPDHDTGAGVGGLVDASWNLEA